MSRIFPFKDCAKKVKLLVARNITDRIFLNEDLLKNKDALHSLSFYLNDNYKKLVDDPVFKMFIDRVKAEARTELRYELAEEYKKKAEEKKDKIRSKLSESSEVKKE